MKTLLILWAATTYQQDGVPVTECIYSAGEYKLSMYISPVKACPKELSI